MFTYGYIREATMAHLDLDEEEAQAMNILSRFHIFANEAMQAICSSKPMYKYIDITVVEKFAPLIVDGAIFRPATEDEIKANETAEAEGSILPYTYVSDTQTENYYHNLNTYQVRETISMEDTFIAFATKQAYKITEIKPSIEAQLEAEAFGFTLPTREVKEKAVVDDDFSYVSKNKLKFYKPGEYLIPAKFLWYRFDSGIGDDDEIDMPSDILLTIPLYIASVCLAIDNLQKAQLLRQQYELALSRCTSGDFTTLNEIEKDW